MHQASKQKPASGSSTTPSDASPSGDSPAATRGPDSGTEDKVRPKGANSIQATCKQAASDGEASPLQPESRPLPDHGVEAKPGQVKSHDEGTAKPTKPKVGIGARPKTPST